MKVLEVTRNIYILYVYIYVRNNWESLSNEIAKTLFGSGPLPFIHKSTCSPECSILDDINMALIQYYVNYVRR